MPNKIRQQLIGSSGMMVQEKKKSQPLLLLRILDCMKPFSFTLICFFLLMPIALASYGWGPDPNRQTIWNNITDTVHTIGKNPTQAQMTRWRLRNQRRINRIREANQATIRAWKNNEA